MSEFMDLLRTLTRLQARAKAASDAAAGVRAKATHMALERWREERSKQWTPDGAVVSLVLPQPYCDVTAPESLCTWLEANGHERLVLRTVHVLDAAAILRALDDEDDLDHDTLAKAVDVRREPVADWTDHVQHQVADEDLISVDGEVIPGARWVTPEPTRIQVRPAKEIVDAETALLGDDDG